MSLNMLQSLLWLYLQVYFLKRYPGPTYSNYCNFWSLLPLLLLLSFLSLLILLSLLSLLLLSLFTYCTTDTNDKTVPTHSLVTLSLFSLVSQLSLITFHWIGPLGRLVIETRCPSVCLYVCPPVKKTFPFIGEVFFKPPHPLSFHPPSISPPYVSCVTCHMSHVTCHMSHVMCHVSCVRGVKIKLFQSQLSLLFLL